MIARRHTLSRHVAGLLGSAGFQPVESGSCSWQLTLKNRILLETQARIDGEWLCLESEVAALSGRTPWELLLENARLPGSVKIVRPGGDASARIRADIPLSANGETSELLADQGRRLLSAASTLAHPITQAPAGAGGPESVDLELVDFEAACESSGWGFRHGLEDSVVVTLGNRSRTFRARLAIHPPGELRGSVSLATFAGLDACRREAIGELLLAASARVPLVRAHAMESSCVPRQATGSARIPFVRAGATEGEDTELLLEATIPLLSGRGVDLLCSALWLACQSCGDEVAVLGDSRLAEFFLRSCVHRPQQNKNQDQKRKGAIEC